MLSNKTIKLEAGHSIECITDADHSIAFNTTVVRSGVVVWQDGRAGPSRCATTQPQRDSTVRLSRRDVMHFVTLWPWLLTFCPNIHFWVRYHDGLSLYSVRGIISVNRIGFCARHFRSGTNIVSASPWCQSPTTLIPSDTFTSGPKLS